MEGISTEECCSFIIFLIFVILFGAYTSDDSDYAPCSTKSSTYEWAHFTYVSMIVCFLLQVGLFLIIKCGLANSLNALFCSGVLLILIRLASVFLNFVSYIGLSYAYSNEECGSLSNLVIVYIILISKVLLFSFVSAVIGVLEEKPHNHNLHMN